MESIHEFLQCSSYYAPPVSAFNLSTALAAYPPKINVHSAKRESEQSWPEQIAICDKVSEILETGVT